MQAILFDLDGTLTASGPGIIKSVQYALEKMGCPEPDTKKLRFFIGPPLEESMRRFRHFTHQEAIQAVNYYHDYYRKNGVFDNQLYPGVRHLLKSLAATELRIAVASSKPEVFVRQILKHYHLAQYFDQIVGASLDGQQRVGKAAVIEEALRRLGMINSRNQVLMVGDTDNDIDGAQQERIACWGVSYGYGTVQELQTAGAQVIVNDVPTLERKLIKLKPRS